MIDTAALFTVVLVYAAGVIIPGPNFVLVVRQAAAGSRALALATVAGIVAVNALWAGAALFGLAVALNAWPWARDGLRIAGGLYLIYVGVRLWLDARQASGVADEGIGLARAGLGRAFARGALTNLANPKSMVFYASVFSAAAPPGAGAATLLAMMAAVVVIAFVWYGAVALLLSTAGVSTAYRRARTALERACGGVMIGFGGKLALLG